MTNFELLIKLKNCILDKYSHGMDLDTKLHFLNDLTNLLLGVLELQKRNISPKDNVDYETKIILEKFIKDVQNEND